MTDLLEAKMIHIIDLLAAQRFYIKDQLNDNNILISRIAYGVPMGGELEYVDNTTLGRAIQGRREIN